VVRRTEVIRHEALVLEGMLWADGDHGLGSLHGAIALGAASLLPPRELLLQDVEHGDDVAQAAAESGLVSQEWSPQTHRIGTVLCMYLCRGTLPYVTEIMATSSSSGEALRASSMAMMSSTPGRAMLAAPVLHSMSGEGRLLAWVGVDDDLVRRHREDSMSRGWPRKTDEGCRGGLW